MFIHPDFQIITVCWHARILIFATSYFHLCAFRHIRSSFTIIAAEVIVSTIVVSCLYYCNSLLASMSASNRSHLQASILPENRLISSISWFCFHDNICTVEKNLDGIASKSFPTTTFNIGPSLWPSEISEVGFPAMSGRIESNHIPCS